MQKSVGIAVGLLVVAGVASAAGTWYTGQQLESSLGSAIATYNQELKNVLPGLGLDVSVELLSLEPGVLSSTAHYRVKALGKVSTTGEETKAIDGELLFVDRIEHGPFPLSRVMHLQLMPVMMKNNIELEKSPLVEKWFTATKDVAPISVQASTGYSGSVNGSIKLQALEYSEDGASLAFSGLDMNVQTSAGRKNIHVDGGMDSLVLVGDDKTRIELHGLSLNDESTMGESGLYLGTSKGHLEQIQVLTAEQPPLLIKHVSQTGILGEDQSGIFGSFVYGIGMVNFAGQDLGSLELGGSVKSLNTLAVKDLAELYKQVISHLDLANYDAGNPAFDLDAEQQVRFESGINTLLAGKPVLALDKFALKTANGESRFNLGLGLNKPSAFDLPPDELARQTIASLNAHLQVSKPMLKDMVLSQAAFNPGVDPAEIKQQAEQMSEMAGMMAVGTQMAKVEGDNIVTTIKYADGQVELNGSKMSLEEFVALSMASGMPQASGGDEGEQGYAEESAEEAVEESAEELTEESDEDSE